MQLSLHNVDYLHSLLENDYDQDGDLIELPCKNPRHTVEVQGSPCPLPLPFDYAVFEACRNYSLDSFAMRLCFSMRGKKPVPGFLDGVKQRVPQFNLLDAAEPRGYTLKPNSNTIEYVLISSKSDSSHKINYVLAAGAHGAPLVSLRTPEYTEKELAKFFDVGSKIIMAGVSAYYRHNHRAKPAASLEETNIYLL